ncbi:hypothetical protein [Vitiosangium sp. GDMCC 1.1324]|uniref:hypothetical protein n=1 Tax=Vitiosangium sp. (strain GDMCC 1.1324) TaxID=2138576 RepID=UPI000D3AD9B9|nr:hypothetical protein [Vitiosangium sp. GDMCC 1.1324]PTL78343.1 hypothetical protein DAT35_40560 [Vitiosangium sp. GDMCC 1.1324]
MSRHVLLAVLCLSLTASADTPNLFEPQELSSGDVVTFVVTCADKVKKSNPSLSEDNRLRYCMCAADALRLRHKQKVKDETPSPEDLRRCATEALKQSPAQEAQAQSQPEPSPADPSVVPASTQAPRDTDWSVDESDEASSSESPSSAPARTCCKVCKKGCPCGDSCISCSKVCHKGPGCAC